MHSLLVTDNTNSSWTSFTALFQTGQPQKSARKEIAIGTLIISTYIIHTNNIINSNNVYSLQ